MGNLVGIVLIIFGMIIVSVMVVGILFLLKICWIFIKSIVSGVAKYDEDQKAMKEERKRKK